MQPYQLKTELYPHWKQQVKTQPLAKTGHKAECDFDPFVKFGRDSMLFVKRDYLDTFVTSFRFTEPELNIIKDLYVSYATPSHGLDLEQFSKLFALLSNIESHPFIKEMFVFFDKDANGFVDYGELVKGLDVVERGTFDEKTRYCFDVLDIYAL